MFIGVAIFGGVLGALFNQIVEHLNHLRAHHINSSGVKRILEVTAIVVVTGSVAVFLPAIFECKYATRDLLMVDSMGCLSPADRHQISYGEISHSALSKIIGHCNHTLPLHESDSNIRRLSEEQHCTEQAKAAGLQLAKHRVHPDNRKDPYTEEEAPWRDVVWIDTFPNDKLNEHMNIHYPHQYSCKNSTEFNAMAMLWLNGGVKGVKVLMQRGFPHVIPGTVLLIFCPVYFMLAAITSGISVPAGLVVPMLLIGGSYGRAAGLLGIGLKKWICDDLIGTLVGDPSSSYYWSATYRWVARDCGLPDPGFYAVVGMASFLGGSGRITVMLATVMIELTDDVSLIAPVGVACIISMIVGNQFNHGLYHGLIPVFNLPFLNGGCLSLHRSTYSS